MARLMALQTQAPSVSADQASSMQARLKALTSDLD
jgi:hypothetical protein